MKITQFVGLGAILAMTACAAPPPPPAIQGEVILNKYGQPTGCVGGEYIPGAPYEEQCLPPQEQEECDPNDPVNYEICYPFRDEEDDQGRDDSGYDPTYF